VRFGVAGDTTAQARACNRSAAARIVRRACPGEGGAEKLAVTRCTVRREMIPGGRPVFSCELPPEFKEDWFPSLSSPATLTITTRCLTKCVRKLCSIARTAGLITLVGLGEDMPTRRSTSPTLINWRSKSSAKKVSSAKALKSHFQYQFPGRSWKDQIRRR